MRVAAFQVFAGLTNVCILCIIVLDRWSVEGHAQPRKGVRASVQRVISLTTYFYKVLTEGGGTMDVNTVMQLVTTLGFPIVCCIALFWRMIKSDENHKEEMEKLSEALNNNTLAINKLNERLNHGEN